MASVVAIGAASHAPMMLAARDSAPPEQGDRFFAGLSEMSAALADADALVVVSNEHFTNFFLDNIPAYCVGVGSTHFGPVEAWLGPPAGQIPGHPPLAGDIVTGLMGSGFDPSFSHDLRLDHGIMTVYHAVSPGRSLPLIPVIQNCAVAPMMPLRRSFELGQALRSAIEQSSSSARVAVVGAGGLSHWVGTPRVGDIDDVFDRWFLDALERGDLDDVMSLPDHELEQAGNGAHEIRSWLTAAGAASPVPARVLAYEAIQPWITGMGVVLFDRS